MSDGWGALGRIGIGLFNPRHLLADPIPDVSVVKGSPGPATRTAVELLGGMEHFVKPGNRVVIKPNMSWPTPLDRCANTHPEVVRELVVMCKEAGASKTLVVDHTFHDSETCLKSSGIRDACNSVKKDIVYTVNDESQYSHVSLPNGKHMKSTDIMKVVLKSDVLIAAPVAKSHATTGVSLSLKGMMGLIYDRRVMHWYDLHSAIVDICKILKANLTVTDATSVLSTGGPNGPGKVLKENIVIASKDMVASDAFTVSNFEWYGGRLRPSQVAHIREAHERGSGRMDIKNLNIKKVKL